MIPKVNPMSIIFLRTANALDLQEMQQLFVNTVTTICCKDYNNEQLKAWISGVKDTQRWLERLDEQFVLLATIDKQIVGFGSIRDENYLDMLYVHKDFQRQGIAGKIYTQLEEKAREVNSSYIDADVSITAKPFFESIGFTVLAEQKVERMGVELVNYRMRKDWVFNKI